MINIQEELNAFVEKILRVSYEECPSFLAPNSNFMGIIPGHNLDLLQISFDFRVDRTTLLLSETPNTLKDPLLPDLRLLTRDIK